MVSALMASFQPGVPPVTLVRFFCGVARTRYKTLSADCSPGKCPRRRQACRNLEFRLSTAFVVYTILRISGGKARNGVSCSQALRQSRMIAGYLPPQARSNPANRCRAAASVGAV